MNQTVSYRKQICNWFFDYPKLFLSEMRDNLGDTTCRA